METVKLLGNTSQKIKFSVKDFFSKCDQFTFTGETLNGKIYFLCSETKYIIKKGMCCLWLPTYTGLGKHPLRKMNVPQVS